MDRPKNFQGHPHYLPAIFGVWLRPQIFPVRAQTTKMGFTGNLSCSGVLLWRGHVSLLETRGQGWPIVGSRNFEFLSVAIKNRPRNLGCHWWQQKFWILDFFRKRDPYLFKRLGPCVCVFVSKYETQNGEYKKLEFELSSWLEALLGKAGWFQVSHIKSWK